MRKKGGLSRGCGRGSGTLECQATWGSSWSPGGLLGSSELVHEGPELGVSGQCCSQPWTPPHSTIDCEVQGQGVSSIDSILRPPLGRWVAILCPPALLFVWGWWGCRSSGSDLLGATLSWPHLPRCPLEAHLQIASHGAESWHMNFGGCTAVRPLQASDEGCEATEERERGVLGESSPCNQSHRAFMMGGWLVGAECCSVCPCSRQLSCARTPGQLSLCHREPLRPRRRVHLSHSPGVEPGFGDPRWETAPPCLGFLPWAVREVLICPGAS